MDRWKDDEAVQRVGKKLIDRIDQSLEEEMADLEKEKEKRMELHKLKILAENDNEVAQLQKELETQMASKEKELNEQLEARQKQILGLKKQNLEDRLRVVLGEMSEQQIQELREQFRKEMQQLENTIKAEKKK